MHLDAQLQTLCERIPGPAEAAAAAARQRLDSLTKPRHSLGQLESLLVRLSASTSVVCPTVNAPAVLLAAADHGVANEGVSAYPQVVTVQMVQNFLIGGAAINALAAEAGARIILVDAGVAGDLPNHPGLLRLGIRRGSGNIAREPAMHPDEARQAMLAGAQLVESAYTQSPGLDMLLLADMGIANTTPTAALTSAYTGAAPAETVGRGTGIDDAMLEQKRRVVTMALQRCGNPDRTTPALTLLSELGGLEIAVLAGATLAAAAQRIPILLDGYITTSAALVAAGLAPSVTTHLFASHRSAEPGHRLALEHLGLTVDAGAGPLLQLDLRLGEGSGAALALPLILSATRLMRNMATFGEAGVSDRDT
ncbi:MAG: nicotinate-nucleotide--dimethylbenzimidazole phosphoribosyltransferase [Chloroflexaceae bacterium]|nr:nicotinate-nucleotide--dimethylbenzimidazole phosphoribosyltransferase [Chloroflexaceae bacterium]